MDRNIALEFVRATEAAAISCARLMGRGDNHAADEAAVEAMRRVLNDIQIDGTVVIGEGERDEAPMLFIGEKVGTGGKAVDIALDPLEGTNLCASGGPDALAVMAVAERGKFLHAPDTYMEKIAGGPDAKGVISLEKTPTQNLKDLAEKKKCDVNDLTVVILDRPRHQNLIKEVREAGARIRLIGDGDVSAVLAAASPDSEVDLLMGIGGAPEGVIAAAAMRCLGGEFFGRLKFRSEEEKARANKMGVVDEHKIYSLEDLASGPVMFVATGVTSGSLLKGVRFTGRGAKTHSLVMRSRTGTVRNIETIHHFDKKPLY